MNRRRWLICFGGTMLALLVLAAFLFLLWDRGPIRFENVEKIQVGMTPAEVVTLLGCNKGVHSTGSVVHMKTPLPDGSRTWHPNQVDQLVASLEKLEQHADGKMWFWLSDGGCVIVVFDNDKKVAHTQMIRGRRTTPPDWWQWIERRLGLDS